MDLRSNPPKVDSNALTTSYITGEEKLVSQVRTLIADSPTLLADSPTLTKSSQRTTCTTATRIAEDLEVYTASFAAYLLPFLERHKSDFFICFQMSFCDICDKKIEIDETDKTEAPHYFHCSTCADGDYDICAACFALGKRCPGTQHQMEAMRSPGILVRYHERLIARLRSMQPGKGKGEAFETKAKNAATGRCFFTTSKGFLGLGPRSMHVGDVVVVLFGGRVPYVLRPTDEYFRFVGECYVHGIMDGEVVRMWRDGKITAREFELR